jgi:hypothetical protein
MPKLLRHVIFVIIEFGMALFKYPTGSRRAFQPASASRCLSNAVDLGHWYQPNV